MAELLAPRALTLVAGQRFRTPAVAVDALTAVLDVSLRRPTAAAPLAWDATGTLAVSIVLLVDGVEYRCTGRVSGGLRTTPDHGAADVYTLRYAPPVLVGARAQDYLTTAIPDSRGVYSDVPLTRIGETAQTGVSAYVEITCLGGSVSTEILRASSLSAPAPRLARYKNSVAFNAATSGSEEYGDNIVTVSHTAAGSDRALFVGVSVYEPLVTGVITCSGGVTVNELWDVNGVIGGYNISNIGASAVAPPTTAVTVTSTLSAFVAQHIVRVVSLTGVHQTTPTGAVPTTTSGTTSPATITVASVGADDLVVDNVIAVADGHTIGAGQTDAASVVLSVFIRGLGSYQAGADGGVMSWSLTDPSTWISKAVAFKPAAGGATEITATDSLRAGLTEYGNLFLSLNSTDAGRVGLSEYGDLRASLDPSEALRAGLQGLEDIVVVVDASDSARIGLVEVADLLAALDPSESLRAGLSDAGSFDNQLDASDSLRVGTQEYGDIRALLDVDDVLAARVSESHDVVVVVDASDSARLGLAEVGDLLAGLAVSDSLRAGLQEAADLLAALAVSDDPRIGLSDTVAVVTITGDVVDVFMADSLRAGLAEAGYLDNQLDASESVRAGLSEFAGVLVLLSVADLLPAGLADAADVVVVVDATDALRAGLQDAGIPYVSLEPQESLRAGLAEEAALSAESWLTEALRAGLEEALDAFVEADAADSLRVVVLDVGVVVDITGAGLGDVVRAFAAFLGDRTAARIDTSRRAAFLGDRTVEEL